MNSFEYNSQSGVVFLHRLRTPKQNVLPDVMHSHPSHELFLLIDGKVQYTVNGQSFEVRPNDLLILNAYEYHVVKVDSSINYERMVLEFPPNLLPIINNVSPLGNFISDTSCVSIIPADYVKKSNIYKRFLEIEKICLADNDFKDHLILAKTIELSVEISDTIKNMLSNNAEIKQYSQYKYPQVTACVQYVNNHLNEQITVEDVTRQTTLSKSRLQHLFKEIMGCSIFDYVKRQKMQMASFLLNTGKSPLETANELGYEYYSTFHHAFKNFYGYTPQDLIRYTHSKMQ